MFSVDGRIPGGEVSISRVEASTEEVIQEHKEEIKRFEDIGVKRPSIISRIIVYGAPIVLAGGIGIYVATNSPAIDDTSKKISSAASLRISPATRDKVATGAALFFGGGIIGWWLRSRIKKR